MRQDLPNKGIGLNDKVILIIIAVITAGGSFMLGYFVGKNTAHPPVIQSAAPKGQEPSVNPPAVESRIPVNEGKKPEAPTSPAVTASLKKEEAPPVKQTVQVPEDKKVTAPEPKAATDLKPIPAKGAVKEKLTETAQNTPKVSESNVKKYTVQTGAFKKQKEADNIKIKLENKGYKANIKTVTSKGGTIHKVIVGDFNSKKEAEVFALKLKKTEGINAFAAVSE